MKRGEGEGTWESSSHADMRSGLSIHLYHIWDRNLRQNDIGFGCSQTQCWNHRTHLFRIFRMKTWAYINSDSDSEWNHYWKAKKFVQDDPVTTAHTHISSIFGTLIIQQDLLSLAEDSRPKDKNDSSLHHLQQPRHESSPRAIKCRSDNVHTPKAKYHSAIKRKEFCHCRHVDGPTEYCAAWNKSDREREILHGITYMWNFRK